mmetsp:Transcript_28024/g.64153  ORF Transcript_28024/g.64153 Transcript_28024/m.64153 type:complete len:231 (+) Transcript_28024:515-1207(+)
MIPFGCGSFAELNVREPFGIRYSARLKISGKRYLATGYVLVSSDLRSDEGIAGIGDIYHFIALKAILSNPQPLHIKLGHALPSLAPFPSPAFGIVLISHIQSLIHFSRALHIHPFGVPHPATFQLSLYYTCQFPAFGVDRVLIRLLHCFDVRPKLDEIIAKVEARGIRAIKEGILWFIFPNGVRNCVAVFVSNDFVVVFVGYGVGLGGFLCHRICLMGIIIVLCIEETCV